MKLVYFAHPYGDEFDNYNRSCAHADFLNQKYPQYHIFNAVRYFVQFDHVVSETEIMKRCLDMVARCDMLWLAPGWEQSKGCQAEYIEATKLGMPIKYISKQELCGLAAPSSEKEAPWEKPDFSMSDIFSDIKKTAVSISDQLDAHELKVDEPSATTLSSTDDGNLIIEVDSGIEISFKSNRIHVKKA